MATFKKVVTETSANTIAQSTTGSSATLTSAQNFSITGDVTASAVSFNGSGAVALSTSLASGVVDATALATNAVTNVKMADDSVNSAEIADGAVDPVHLAGLGANGTAGQVLQSDGDGTFSWVNQNSGDIQGVTAGVGLSGGGSGGTVTVNLENTISNVTELTNNALLIGVSDQKPRIKFEFDGSPAEGKILFGIDDDTDTMEFVSSGNDSANQDILRPTANRSVQLGSSSNTWEDIHTRSTRTVFFHLNGTQVTSTGAELNILDGVTADKDEINILDGVTATTAELNILDGVTATTSELNILDGVTSTATELNLLDGVTATTAELNYVDGVTSNIQTQLNAKAPLASPSFTGNVTVGGDLTVSGTTITTNTETLEIADNTLVLNSDLTGTAVDAGIVVEQGSSGDNACLWYDASEGAWVVGSNSSASLPSSGTRIALQSVKATLDTTDTSVPVGGFQVAGGVAYVRTA